MATLLEYFEKDQGDTVVLCKTVDLLGTDIQARARLHISFESGAKYVSYYVPKHSKGFAPVRALLEYVQSFIQGFDTLDIRMGFGDLTESTSNTEACFTGRVNLYCEDAYDPIEKNEIFDYATSLGLKVKVRSKEFVQNRSRHEIPIAFISHDHRDKDELARPLAAALQKMWCPVWYDEYSLTVGESLRESIERGLKQCQKCVFALTPNFLMNGGWAKREYDSIFTRELVMEEKVIVPIWRGVTKRMVFDYSPILADRVAAIWPEGMEPDAAALEIAARVRSSILSTQNNS